MASAASHSLPCSLSVPASASAILDDDQPLFLSSSPAFPDPAALTSSFPVTAAQEPQPPPPAAEARKPPRKRPRPSRRPPTTVFTTDASNFRAMVQEFTGFPAPAFAPHLGSGVLFGAGGAPSYDSAAAAGAPFQLLRPSPLKLFAADLHASGPTCTASSLATGASAMFTNTNANPAAAVKPSSSSGVYSSIGSMLHAGAVPRYDGGFETAEDERVDHGHGFFSSFLHAGDRYHGR